MPVIKAILKIEAQEIPIEIKCEVRQPSIQGRPPIERGLYFMPHKSPDPDLFNVAHHALREKGQWNEDMVKEYKCFNYFTVASLSDPSQEKRLELAKYAEQIGFDAINVDERFSMGYMNAEQFKELQKAVKTPIYVTDAGGALNHWVVVGGIKPEVAYVELFDSNYKGHWNIIDHNTFKAQGIKVIPCVNIGDTTKYSAIYLDQVLSYVKTISKEICLFGWLTGVEVWQKQAERNWSIIRKYYKL